MEYAGMDPTSSKSNWEDSLLYNIVEEDQTSNPTEVGYSVPSRHTRHKASKLDQEVSLTAESMLMVIWD